MKEGYWLRFDKGQIFLIDEHEMWIRRAGNAKKLSLPSGLISCFKDYKPQDDRYIFLLHLMCSAPIMRVRGHGTNVTFEFGKKRLWKSALAMVAKFIKKQELGPKMIMSVTNLATLERVTLLVEDFLECYNVGGHKAVLEKAELLDDPNKNVLLKKERRRKT